MNVCHELFLANFLKDGSITIFGNCEEAEGLPTLVHMGDLAACFAGEVVHLGYGCFSVRNGGDEVFGFLGGGAMSRLEVAGRVVGHTRMSFRDEVFYPGVVSWLREKFPLVFAEADCRLAQRTARKGGGA